MGNRPAKLNRNLLVVGQEDDLQNIGDNHAISYLKRTVGGTGTEFNLEAAHL